MIIFINLDEEKFRWRVNIVAAQWMLAEIEWMKLSTFIAASDASADVVVVVVFVVIAGHGERIDGADEEGRLVVVESGRRFRQRPTAYE